MRKILIAATFVMLASSSIMAQGVAPASPPGDATTTPEKEKIAIFRGLALSYLDSAVDSQAAVRSMLAEIADLKKRLVEAEKKAEPKPADKPAEPAK